MLSFFRKYERTFFLIVFAPAILGMGVTSVIVTVLTKEGPHFNGKIFGEPISAAEWDSYTVPYRKTHRNTNSEEGSDQIWQFFAEVKTAERAGIRIPDAVLAEEIVTEKKLEIAQRRALRRIMSENLDRDTPEGQQKFRQYLLEGLQNPDFTESEYRETLDAAQMTVSEFEAHTKREKMRRELLDSVKNSATVGPDEIWKTFRERNQTRAAEVVTLDAAAYVPSSASLVSDADVLAYYNSNKDLYDEPKRVDLEFVAATFEKTRAEVGTPGEDALLDYYGKHQEEYRVTPAPVGTLASPSYIDSFVNVRGKVLETVTADLAADRAQRLLELVQTKLEEQLKASGKVDMAAAIANVGTATTALVHDRTGLLEPDAISTHAILNGFTSYKWANSEPKSETRTSDPLKGERAVFILRTADLKEKRSPSYDELKARVAEDYLKGNDKELKRYYDANSHKYMTEDRWKVDVLVASYDEFDRDPNIDEPQPADLDSLFNVEGAKLWPGKARKDVPDADLKKAWHYAQARKTAQAALKAVNDLCRDSFTKDKKSNLDINKSHPNVKKAGFLGGIQTFTLDRAGLAANAILKKAATSVPIQQAEDPSQIYTSDDEKSQFFFVVRERLERKVPELAEVREKVAKDLLLTRGFDRAKDAGDKLVVELKGLTGDALAKKLLEKNLSANKSDFFARTATMVPNMPGTQRVVSETYACEIDGGFERVVADKPSNKVWLVRCAGKKDPEDSLMAAQGPSIRKELLRTKREEFARAYEVDLELRAKGISPEHVKWVRARRDGPGGQVSSKVRQIFVPNDRPTLDAWLDDAARKKLDEALAKLQKDVAWQAVVFEFTDDTSTRGVEGELRDVARGELTASYGAEFEDKVFSMPANGQVSVPIKSKLGWHLVKVTKAASAVPSADHRRHGEIETRMSFKHILVKTDPTLRNLPADVAAKARDLARGKAQKALERLKAGEPFAKVGADTGDDDARAKGETFTVPYISPVVRMALRQKLEQNELEKALPEELDVAGGKEWHLMLCARDPQDKEPSFKAAPNGPRLVFECVGPTQDSVLQARRELERWQKDKVAENKEPSFPELLHQWKKICETRSTAPSKGKQGAFGQVQTDPVLRPLDDDVVARMMATAAGQRSEIIESKDGFRIVECVSVETKAADDGARDREVGQALLHGTDWIEDR